MRFPRLPALAGLIAVGLLGAGIGVGWLATSAATTPATLKPPAPVTMVQVTAEKFVDARTVELSLVRGAPQNLTSPRPGTLTASSCAPGAITTSGATTFSIDGRPLLNLHLGTPLWRVLSSGDEGPDVDAVHTELARLGHPVEGRAMSSATLRELNRLRTAVKTPTKQTLGPEDIVWLPTQSPRFSTCPGVGAAVAPGDSLATLPAPLLGVEAALPADAASGARVAVLDGERFALSSTGAVNAKDLAKLTASPSYAAIASDPEARLTASLQLADPVQVLPVPAAAIGAVTGDRSCVVADTGTVPVRVVGSQLGRTFVIPDGPLPTSVSIDPARPRQCT